MMTKVSFFQHSHHYFKVHRLESVIVDGNEKVAMMNEIISNDDDQLKRKRTL